jgi:hypothetical protein
MDLRIIFVAAVGFIVVVIASTLMTAEPGFSDWAVPVNLGPVVNSTSGDAAPALSRNELSLYFGSNRSGGVGGADIWVSQRNSLEEPWGPPINLGPVINSDSNDGSPNLSRDGHWLFFQSIRPGGFGSFDIWVSYREHIHDDFDWQPPVNAGPIVNSPNFEMSPFFFDNDDVGVPQLFFARTPPSPFVNHIFVSNLLADGTFGTAVVIPELDSTASQRGISVRFDGHEVFFMSSRSGGSGGFDLWTATRKSVLDPWSAPTNLGPLVNSVAGDFDPHIASDRATLYFSSNRTGGVGGDDLYVTTRTRERP